MFKNIRKKLRISLEKVGAKVAGASVFTLVAMSQAYAIDSTSTLYPAYTLLIDVKDLITPIADIAIALLTVIIAFSIVGFIKGIFRGTISNMSGKL